MRKFYITTPIYYVNAEPHIGSAYTTIIADIIARYKRFMGYDVFFLTGTDEHGLKILQAAQAKGKKPKEFCDELAQKFKDLWKDLKITNDYFIRTTDPEHEETVKFFVQKMKENGDVYKGTYSAWYCVHCETYYDDEEVVEKDGKKVCPVCGREVKWVEEENYFFRLSKYNDALKRHFEENPDFVEPDFRRNEMLKILEKGLKDISITRTTFKWGIPFPGDEDHVIYVWVDALINYVSALGYGRGDEKFKKYWPADLHLIGKEINRFHSLIWPAMLMSVGLPLPEKVFAHGWLTVNGQKISKSLGNAIDPREFVKKYSNDVVRYYLVRDIVFGKDGDFSEEKLVRRLNSDLANDYGNLLHRTLAMVKKHFDSKVPRPYENEEIDRALIEETNKTVKKFVKLMDNYKLTEALDVLWNYIAYLNTYFDRTRPWILAKEENKERLATVLYNTMEGILKVALMALPVMPDSSEEVLKRLGFDEKPTFGHLEKWGILRAGAQISHGKPLFEKIDLSKFKKVVEVNKEMKEVETGVITIDDFAKVDLRVAKILNAERVEGSEKLIRMDIDLGELGKRQLVGGLAKHYKPEELVGRLIVVVVNLKPRKLFGFESRGMLLAAKYGDKLKLITVEGEIEPGAKIS
ncbi:MAG: methionine--tRNA ligase [Thermotogaceae bacterium]|nr:methionine--tRNA ligase [Thermotogaceae bacterium]